MPRHPIPDAALDDRLGFTGTAGSGKTYNAGGAVERVLAHKGRVIWPDPLGVTWGLRLMADGKTPSPFNVVIFGGPHGDIALTEHAGALIGETVAGMAESCILDLSELGTKAAERRFMLAFLTALYRHASGEPVHLVFDEADMWAPQRLMDKDGDAARLLGMMETIVRRGRVKGFIPWLITQRPAVLSKDVLSQVDGLISFKLTSSQDRDALEGWVEGQADKQQWKDMRAALPTLQRGQGIVWMPARGILETASFPTKKTFDSSRTPKRGEKRLATSLKPIDIGALKARLATVETEIKANDPRVLKTKIAELEKTLRERPAEQKIVEKIVSDEQAIQRAATKAKIEGYGEAVAAVYSMASCLRGVLAPFDESFVTLKGAIEKLEIWTKREQQKPTVTKAVIERPIAIVRQPAARVTNSAHVVDASEMSPTSRKIIDVIHRSHPVALTFSAAALRAAVSRRSSAYSKYKKEVETSVEIVMREDGRLTSAPSYVTIFDGPGIDPVNEFESKLPPSYGKMLRAVADHGPVSTDEIADIAGVSTKSSGLALASES